MAKRNVAFTKPDEPSFIKKMKKDTGYKESYDVDTKREILSAGPEDFEKDESEEPQIVVLQSGDLSKEEADKEKARLVKEDEERPADLNQRIIFKSKKKEGNKTDPKKETKIPKVMLSFHTDDEDDDYDAE